MTTRNVTLSADDALIERARERARRERTTLNEVFRAWLARYAGTGGRSAEFDALMQRLSYARAGRRFTRDELNER
jgi:hypothetical protein